jgi:hypothetical protein
VIEIIEIVKTYHTIDFVREWVPADRAVMGYWTYTLDTTIRGVKYTQTYHESFNTIDMVRDFQKYVQSKVKQ